MTHWIAYRRPAVGTPRLRLFCLPYAGGGAGLYRDWGRDLPADIDVCPVLLPGREMRLAEAPIGELSALVRALADGLAPLLDAPVVLFGHSMGAALALELARWMEASAVGGHPRLRGLIVSGRAAPGTPPHRPPIHRLSDPEFLAALGKLGGTPAEVLANAELMEIMLPMLRADFTLVETHAARMDPPLAAPVLVLHGTDDAATQGDVLEPWRQVSSAEVRFAEVGGGHFFINSARTAVLGEVARFLAR